jgi:hypothetical protein
MDEAFRNVVSYTNRACTGLRSGAINNAMIVPEATSAKTGNSLDGAVEGPRGSVCYPTVLTHGLKGRRIAMGMSG